jgi:hypothetical protein
MQRPFGMTPAMFDAYIRGMYYAGINPAKTSHGTKRVVQTMGTSVSASAGTHAQQGTVTDSSGKKIAFGACVDISVRGLTKAQIKKMLLELAKQGYAGWFRDWDGNEHCHIVYCGHFIKDDIVINQIIDYLNDRTGLVGHAKEQFFTAPTSVDKPLAKMFARSNPNRRKRIPKHLLED